MKLLFDENLSPKLPRQLAALFPDSVHVRDCGLLGMPDENVWEYARSNGFTIVSKDSDFQQRSLLYGHPPRFIWFRIGNCTTKQLVQWIMTHQQDIRTFETDPLGTVLILS